jgi:thiamine-phosphate pyrophosphorylase
MTLEHLLRTYLVTDARAGSVEKLISVCESAIAGGVSAIQLRAKGWPDSDLLRAANRLRALTLSSGTLFIVNDRVDVVLASKADGVHLGVDDLPVSVARSLLGGRAVIGYSPETPEDRIRAERDGADYLGIGPVFGSKTKDDAGPALGLEQFRSTVAACNIPVVGIGGISIENARSVIDAGAAGVAVVGAVFFDDDPHAASTRLVDVLS